MMYTLVAEATAAVLLDGSRKGSAVLVDGRHLLTARHVLRQRSPDGRPGPDAETVSVYFPTGAHAGLELPATQLELPEAAGDVAVLDLGASPGVSLPAPVPLWPGRRLPNGVRVLGFPRAEKDTVGVWRRFAVAAPVAGGLVQLDWDDVGTLRGHSGGPVVSADEGGGFAAVVGVLVQGAAEARFDRFVSIAWIRRWWSGLPRPWLFVGPEGRDHFARRARGQRSTARGGDLFRGRAEALTAVTAWLTRADPPGRPLVVTGQPGAGKSSVVARAVLQIETAGVGPGLAFHARGATHDDLLQALADLTGAPATSRDQLLTALKDGAPAETTLVVVDALDEAASPTDRHQLAETLAELASLEHTRVAVATRPMAADDRDRLGAGALLPALGVRAATASSLVDLDTDRYFDPDGLREFAAATLAQEGDARPAPAGAAWQAYRADPALRGRLATVIRDRAGRNYLVAAMASRALSVDDQPVDSAGVDFDVTSIPSQVEDALAKYLSTLDPARRQQTLGLLTALAYTRGDGVNDTTWLLFADKLGYPATPGDLDELRRDGAADYLLQSVADTTGRVTRLFHQALVDELFNARHHQTDERHLLDGLLARATITGWEQADPYTLRHLADHADAAGRLARLLDDVGFVATADLTRLLPRLTTDAPATSTPLGSVLYRAGTRAAALDPAARLQFLALAAAHLGLHDLRDRLASSGGGACEPVWAHTLGPDHRELPGHTGRVEAVAVARVGDRDLIVSGGRDGTVRRWDAATGEPVGTPLTGHTDRVQAVAVARVGDRDLIVSGSSNGTVRRWDAATGEPVGTPLTGHTDWVEAVAVARVGGRDLIVSGSSNGTVRRWDAATGEPVGAPLTGHTDRVQAVAVARVGGRDLIISGGRDGTVRRWDAATGEPVGTPLTGHTGAVRSIAAGSRTDSRHLIVSGGHDGTVRRWDAATGEPVGPPLTGHTGSVYAVAVGRVGGRDLIVSGSDDATVRLWHAEVGVGEPVGTPLTGHTGTVQAVAVARVAGRDLIVSGSSGGTVRRWDAATGEPVGPPLTGHTGTVQAVAVARVAGRDLIVSGSGRDGTVRRWDAATGEPVGPPLTGHTIWVQAVAVGRVGDRDLIVSGSSDSTVRRWDAATGEPVGSPLTGHTGWVSAVAVGRVGDRDLIVSGSDDGTVRRWDAATGEPVGSPLTGHISSVSAVAVGRVGERDLIVSGSDDCTVRRWDAATGEPVGSPLTGHTSSVSAVSVGRVADRDLIVSGSDDGTVRLWRTTGDCLAVLHLLGPVYDLAITSEVLAVATATAVATYRWT